jgi:hydroxyethylthiazole kinase
MVIIMDFSALQAVREKNPLIHCITNYVTVNDCANILLACGASPIMAEDVHEMEEIASAASGLLINIGTITEDKLESILLAGKTANENSRPVILDPVGAGATAFRLGIVKEILQSIHIDVIKGNSAEICALVNENERTAHGVDAGESVRSLSETTDVAAMLCRDTGAVVMVTGETDIITDGSKAIYVKNGHPFLSKITGSGCMLGALTAAYYGAQPSLEAAASAAVCMGYAGELAYARMTEKHGGSGTFRVFLIDAVNQMTAEMLERGAKLDV